MTAAKKLQKAIETLLADRGASSADGCSALSTALLNSFVKLRQDPHVEPAVTVEMRRFATRVTQLAVALSDGGVIQ